MKILKIAIFLLFACVIGGCSKTEETKISLESISIQSTISLQEGKTQQLTATTAPSGITEPYTLAWSSSNAEVATVDGNGNVKALKPGTSTVKVYEQSRPNISASCAVTVTATPVEIASVSFVNPPQTLEEEESKTLETKVAPENINQPYELVFTSSNPTVATVSSDGVLKTLKAGQATIGVAVKDKPEIKADFQLEVIAKDFTIEIPDANFKAFLVSGYDTNHDGEIQLSEALNVRGLQCQHRGIKSLKGIEYFTNLNLLYCDHNEIEEMDLSNNSKLMWFTCSYNKLTSLDISNKPELRDFNCSYNPITVLNAQNCTSLTYLSADTYKSSNQININNIPLKELDARGCSSLKHIRCSNKYNLSDTYPGAMLQKLNVTGCSSLDSLAIKGGWDENREHYGGIAELDLTGCNSLTYLQAPVNDLQHLDLSPCKSLKTVYVHGNKNLEDINVSQNTELELLYTRDSKISGLDLSNCVKLKELDCGDNNMTEVDISKNKSLVRLFAYLPIRTIYVWKGFSTEGRYFTIPGSAVYVEKE